MKLLHTADLHLGSKMQTHLPPDRARVRKAELLRTFSGMVEYAQKEGVTGILIAGDLFDHHAVSAKNMRMVLDEISMHPTIAFYILTGNHDKNIFTGELPQNLFLFEDGFTSYMLDTDTVLWGRENLAGLTDELLPFDPLKTNIVMLHGQTVPGHAGGDEDIPLGYLAKRSVDYLALGHLHAYRADKLDNRGVYCYAGTPEGRGFDECGRHGFVLLEIEDRKVRHRFLPFAQRTLHAIDVDISYSLTEKEAEKLVMQALADIKESDMVRLTLKGSCPTNANHSATDIATMLSERFFFAKVIDKTRLAILPEDFQGDISLKGEFIRTVKDAKPLGKATSEEQEEEINRIISYGLRALRGEDIES